MSREPEGGDLVFGTGLGRPFAANTIYRRTDRAWRRAELEALSPAALDALAVEVGIDAEADKLIGKLLNHAEAGRPEVRMRLHQARHTYASFMIAAGVNAKALSSYMGHSSIKVTFDLYGHLMPGSEAEAAELLGAFLERSNTTARVAAVSS